MLPAAYRLTMRRDFSRVYTKGRSNACREFALYCLPRKGEDIRIGFSSSKKLGGAVERNRARRVFRHAAAGILESFPAGCDYIFVIRTGAMAKSSDQIRRTMLSQLQKAQKEGLTQKRRKNNAASNAAPAAHSPAKPGM